MQEVLIEDELSVIAQEGQLSLNLRRTIKFKLNCPSCAITLNSSSISTSCTIILFSCYIYCYLVILVLQTLIFSTSCTITLKL